MSLWAEYIRERLGAKMLESENAFLSYSETDHALVILDLFVRPEARGVKEGWELFKVFSRIAQASGKAMEGTLWITAPKFHRILSLGLRCGFKVKSAHDGAIILRKEV